MLAIGCHHNATGLGVKCQRGVYATHPGKHWFNHLLVSPDGRRTIILHRWRTQPNRWFTRRFTVGLDGSGLREINPGADVLERDGHGLYLPGADWILSDTYPQGADRLQEVYLYDVAQQRRVTLGRFHSPTES